ncbi:solute carrier family 22 member 6-B-like [Dermacentor albipictus]|uniref:solute carrier family 22 member 6-B-like n=1 Tax=Dermacentor albipictus TaxID=60249 RepID=UPI0038FD2256
MREDDEEDLALATELLIGLFSAKRLARVDLKSSECFDCNDLFGNGLFQKGIAFVTVVSVLAVHCHTQTFPLVAGDVDHWCRKPADVNMSMDAWKNATVPLEPDGRFSRCSVYDRHGDPNSTQTVQCLEWDYDPERADETLVSRWNLVCHRRPLVGVANAVYSAGALVGMFGAAYMAAHIGRKLVVLSSTSALLIGTVGITFAETYVMYVTTRFVNSAAVTTVAVTSITLLIEVSPDDRRVLYSSVSVGMGLTLADFWFGTLKQVHTSWRLLQASMLMPTVFLTSALFLVEESPRWLVFKRKLKAAEAVMLAAAKTNGFSLPTTAAMMVRITDEIVRNQEALQARTPLDHVFNVHRSLFIMSICHISVTFAFYTVLKSPALKGDAWIRWNALVVQALFYYLMTWTIKRFTRRQVITAYLLALGGIGLFMSASASVDFAPSLLSQLCYAAARGCAYVAIAVNLCYAAELFPTPLRSAAVCWIFACGRVSAVATSVLSALQDVGLEDVELVIMAALAFASAIAFQHLPEDSSSVSISGTSLLRSIKGSSGEKLDLGYMQTTLQSAQYAKKKKVGKQKPI